MPASVCSRRFGSFGVEHWPPACWRPYGPRSPFNVPIPRNPRLAPDAVAVAGFIRSQHWAFEGNGSANFSWDDGGSRPVYWSKRTDPLITVRCRGEGPCRSGMKLHVPAAAQPQNQSDGHMAVVDQERGLEYDFWKASKPESGSMTTSGGGAIRITSTGGTGLGGAAEAADLGLLGGLIRAPELAAGRIEHALITTVQCVQLHDVWPSPAWGRGDSICPHGEAGPHFGSLLQLNETASEIAASGAPRWQRTIMAAMARYGIYVVDTNGSSNSEMSLLAEDDLSYTSFGYPGQMHRFVTSAGGSHRLVGVPIDMTKLRVIDPCVPRRTC